MRLPILAALAACVAGCASSTPPEPAPEAEVAAAPAPAMASGPSLRIEPGSEHRYLFAAKLSMEMAGGEGMGPMGLEIEQEAIHRIEAPGEDGASRVAVTAIWTRLVLFMEGAGIRFSADSRKPETLGLVEKGGPLETMGVMFGKDAMRFEIHDRRVRSIDGADGGAAPNQPEGGPLSAIGGLEEFVAFPWLNLLPPPRLADSGGAFEAADLPEFLRNKDFTEVSWKVVERNPETGRFATEIRASIDAPPAGSKAAPRDEEDPEFSSAGFVIADVYDAGLGVYGTRRIEFEGVAKGGPMALDSGEGETRIRMLLTYERLGDGAAAPPKSP